MRAEGTVWPLGGAQVKLTLPVKLLPGKSVDVRVCVPVGLKVSWFGDTVSANVGGGWPDAVMTSERLVVMVGKPLADALSTTLCVPTGVVLSVLTVTLALAVVVATEGQFTPVGPVQPVKVTVPGKF